MKTLSSYAHSEVHPNAMNQASWWLHNTDGDGHSNVGDGHNNEGERRNTSAGFLRLHNEQNTASTPGERSEVRRRRVTP